MSWTADIPRRPPVRHGGHVGPITGQHLPDPVEPEYLLAYIHEEAALDEQEYIVDPAGLDDTKIQLYEGD
jgi:hypothetical protein